VSSNGANHLVNIEKLLALAWWDLDKITQYVTLLTGNDVSKLLEK
jgi:hypothetical protein